MTAHECAVSCANITVRFVTDERTVTALDNVSFTLAKGGFLTLLGPSGCGKSTLLRVVADLISPSEGTVEVFGVTAERARKNRALGFVFQDAALLPWRTALENVALPLEVGGGLVSSSRFNSPSELLDLVGLSDWMHAYPHQLSGGMRQRVAIARALLGGPRLLLMDEPFGALDEMTRDRLNEELRRIWAETQTSIIFVTHSVYEAAYLGEEVLVLSPNPGRVVRQVKVDLPMERSLAIRDTSNFIAIAADLRAMLGKVTP